MKTLLGGIALGTAVFLLAGCSEDPIACTAIGVPEGVSLKISAPLAAQVEKALVTVCDAGDCTANEVELLPTTDVEPQECEGTGPNDSCSAVAVPDGGKTGFLPVANLPEAEVEIDVVLSDANDVQVLQETATMTPVRIHPNGPQCDSGGVQLGLTVTEEGILSEVSLSSS